MFEADPLALLAREVLRERAASLVAEVCAWAVGLSDRPYCVRRGRVTPTGTTLGARAGAEQRLGAEEGGRLELAEAHPGSFADALAALAPDGRAYAELLDEQVLAPFALETCRLTAGRARRDAPHEWRELVDDLGADEADVDAVVRGADWEPTVRADAEQLVLDALGPAPLTEVEAEGLPLALVRAAEAQTRAAAPQPALEPEAPDHDEIAGALFLAEAAVRGSGLPLPVPPEHADALLDTLAAEGLEPEELPLVLPHLPVRAETAEEVALALEVRRAGDA